MFPGEEITVCPQRQKQTEQNKTSFPKLTLRADPRFDSKTHHSDNQGQGRGCCVTELAMLQGPQGSGSLSEAKRRPSTWHTGQSSVDAGLQARPGFSLHDKPLVRAKVPTLPARGRLSWHQRACPSSACLPPRPPHREHPLTYKSEKGFLLPPCLLQIPGQSRSYHQGSFCSSTKEDILITLNLCYPL